MGPVFLVQGADTLVWSCRVRGKGFIFQDIRLRVVNAGHFKMKGFESVFWDLGSGFKSLGLRAHDIKRRFYYKICCR